MDNDDFLSSLNSAFSKNEGESNILKSAKLYAERSQWLGSLVKPLLDTLKISLEEHDYQVYRSYDIKESDNFYGLVPSNPLLFIVFGIAFTIKPRNFGEIFGAGSTYHICFAVTDDLIYPPYARLEAPSSENPPQIVVCESFPILRIQSNRPDLMSAHFESVPLNSINNNWTKSILTKFISELSSRNRGW